jgi:Na+-transporting NADH:ubiquinone oxidoreductase subunit A
MGQPLVADRRRPELVHASPGDGHVAAVHRGPRRALEAIVVALDDPTHSPEADEREIGDAGGWRADGERLAPEALPDLPRERIVARLLATGLWTALRARPFGNVARPSDTPRALLVTAIDTRPLAPDPTVVIASRRQAFANGLAVLGRLLDGPLFLCTAPDADVPAGDPARVRHVEFAGPHPAGLAGTQIHFLAPASAGAPTWHVDYQDVIAIGLLFTTGRLSVERVVALAGPMVRRPRLVRTRLGANVSNLLDGELLDGSCRVLSGSVLDGRRASGPLDYLGRYHAQIAVVPESRAPRPAATTHTWSYHSLWSRLRGRARGDTFDTSRHGPRGPLLTLPSLDRVMPLDVLPAPLLRALMVADDEALEALGGLELEEEDLALCAFLCPGKIAWGRLLRAALTRLSRHA